MVQASLVLETLPSFYPISCGRGWLPAVVNLWITNVPVFSISALSSPTESISALKYLLLCNYSGGFLFPG